MIPDGYTTSLLFAATAVYVIYRLLRRNVTYLEGLEERAVLVTGCDTGFGHEVARRLDSLGVTVFAGCLFPEGPGATQLKESCSNKLHVLHLDITNEQQVESAVDFVKNTLKHRELWAVLNNAGIADIGNVEWCSVEDIENVFKVNTLGTFRITKAFLPFIRKSHGRMVFVASMTCHIPSPSTVAYSISKYGILALAEVLRIELKPFGVTVHSIKPAIYRTNITRVDIILKKLTDKWNRLSPEIRSEYGEAYFKDFKKFFQHTQNDLSSPEEKVYEVVDDMLHATIGACPKYNYVPGAFGKLAYLIFLISPLSIQEYIVHSGFKKNKD